MPKGRKRGMKLFLTIQSARTRKAKLATQRMYRPRVRTLKMQCMACGRSEWYNSTCYGGSKEQCEKVCDALDSGVLECKAGCLNDCLKESDTMTVEDGHTADMPWCTMCCSGGGCTIQRSKDRMYTKPTGSCNPSYFCDR